MTLLDRMVTRLPQGRVFVPVSDFPTRPGRRTPGPESRPGPGDAGPRRPSIDNEPLGESLLRDSTGPADLRVSGLATGVEPGWDDRRVGLWIGIFLTIGFVIRLVRYGLNFPLWNDEAYLALNILERDFAGLTRPLGYAQVCPVGFLWAEKAITLALGFSEWSLRALPTVASLASLVLFRHVAGRLLKGLALVFAVGIVSVAYTPIRHGAEVKPYATDFLVALGLLALAIEWLRTPGRTRFLWGMAALGPLAVAVSNPSVFVAAGVAVVLVVHTRTARLKTAIPPMIVYATATAGTFVAMLVCVNGPQGDHVRDWMQLYWANAFPPRTPLRLLLWLIEEHTSQMFAYPIGGDFGASTLTTVMAVTGAVAFVRRGSRTVLALLLVPFALGLAAATAHRYPYGGSARTMQYVAPAIILLAGVGTSAAVARIERAGLRSAATRLVLLGLIGIGFGLAAWDVTHPFKLPFYQGCRDLARQFWAEESAGAELVCARTDLRLPLDPLRWQADRAVMYLCHQAMYSPRHVKHAPPRPDRISSTHPLRVVLFNETPGESAMFSRWIAGHADRLTLTARRERALHQFIRRGGRTFSDRYVVYDFVPAPRP